MIECEIEVEILNKVRRGQRYINTNSNLNEFGYTKSGKCKEVQVWCRQEYEKSQYLKNRDEILKRARAYRQKNEIMLQKKRDDFRNENSEKIRENNKKYHFVHREKINEQNREWYHNNRSSQLQRMKQYQSEHREEIRKYNKEYKKEYNKTEHYKKLHSGYTAKRRQKGFIPLNESIDIPSDWHHLHPQLPFVLSIDRKIHQKYNGKKHYDSVNEQIGLTEIVGKTKEDIEYYIELNYPEEFKLYWFGDY